MVRSPTRASPRLARKVDEHTLLRAERRVLFRNLECTVGNASTDSFNSIPLSNVVDNLRALGLGVGSNSVGSFELNVQNLLVGKPERGQPCSEFRGWRS